MKHQRQFKTVVEAGNGEQPLKVDYRFLPAEKATATYPGADGDIDFLNVERDTTGTYWDNRVTKDYWTDLTEADWQKLYQEAWEDWHENPPC